MPRARLGPCGRLGVATARVGGMHLTVDEVHAFELFAALSEAEAAALGARLVRQHGGRGDFLFRQGEPATHLVLLISGQVKMEHADPDGTAVIVEVLGPGTALAAANFLEQGPYPLTAVCLGEVAYAALLYQDFEALVRSHPDMALVLLAYLASRLHRAYAARRASPRSGVRLAHALARIAADAPVVAEKGPLVQLSHGDLAEVAGLARETVTRHLRVWQRQGIVELGIRQIQVCDMTALRRVAEDD